MQMKVKDILMISCATRHCKDPRHGTAFSAPHWFSFQFGFWASPTWTIGFIGYITVYVFQLYRIWAEWRKERNSRRVSRTVHILGLKIRKATYHLGPRRPLRRFAEPQREAGWFNLAINMFSVRISHGNLFIAPLLYLSPLILCPWVNPSTPPL